MRPAVTDSNARAWGSPPSSTALPVISTRLAAGRSTRIAEVRQALGADYATATATGAAMPDDELVGYLDDTELEARTPEVTGQLDG